MGKTVIFDFDGTIADSAPAILETLQHVLAARHLVPLLPLTPDLIGPPLASTLTTLTGITEADQLTHLATDFKARYDTVGWQSTLLYAGMEQVIHALMRRGYSLMLATNKRQRPTELLLARFRLRECFTAVCCLDSQIPPHADKARMLMAMLATESLTATDCLYIGDTCHDEGAAAQSGIAFMAVAWGYGAGKQQVSTQAAQVATPAALPAAIDGFFVH